MNSDNTSDKVQETKAAERRLLTAKDVALAVVLALLLTCVAAGFVGRSHSSPGAKPIEARTRSAGFTLIEMSIVLVVIGLIIGGVLVGQDLVRAAGVRAQITQIEKYNQAVNTFRGKYQSIPGDMNIATAEQFGFTVGTSCNGRPGARDGNGLLEGMSGTPAFIQYQFSGEVGLFWQDLTTPGLTSLIEGTFPNSGAIFDCIYPAALPSPLSSTTVGQYVPAGKIGHGTSVLVGASSGANWYILQGVTSTSTTGAITGATTPIPVTEAYKIDQKIDDGLPKSGNVQALYLLNPAGGLTAAPHTSSDTTSTCYNSSTNTYSLTINGGVGANCALSFMFQ